MNELSIIELEELKLRLKAKGLERVHIDEYNINLARVAVSEVLQNIKRELTMKHNLESRVDTWEIKVPV